MDGDMKLEKAHNIGGKIKEDLINKYDFITDVITHINPHSIQNKRSSHLTTSFMILCFKFQDIKKKPQYQMC